MIVFCYYSLDLSLNHWIPYNIADIDNAVNGNNRIVPKYFDNVIVDLFTYILLYLRIDLNRFIMIFYHRSISKK